MPISSFAGVPPCDEGKASVPEQKFSDPVSGSEVVVVSWDMGMRAVDIAFGGTLLTQVTDLGPLRETGMQGAAPDGSRLVVRLARGENGEVFTVERSGVQLVGGHVNFAAAGPRIGEAVMAGVRSVTPRADGVGLDAHGRLVVNGQVIDERAAGLASEAPVAKSAIESGRTWLLVFAILNTVGLALMGLATLALSALHHKVANTLGSVRTTGVTSDGRPIDADTVATVKAGLGILAIVLAVFVVTMLVIAVAWWVLWVMSKGAKAALAFGIARAIAGFYLVCSVLQVLSSAARGRLIQGLIGASLGLAINALAFKAFHAARRASVAASSAAA